MSPLPSKNKQDMILQQHINSYEHSTGELTVATCHNFFVEAINNRSDPLDSASPAVNTVMASSGEGATAGMKRKDPPTMTPFSSFMTSSSHQIPQCGLQAPINIEQSPSYPYEFVKSASRNGEG